MNRFAASMLLVAVSLQAAPAPIPWAARPQSKAALAPLQGVWVWTSEDGPKTAVIADDRIRWFCGEADEHEQSFRLDPRRTPKEIDIVVNLGGETYTSKGIYRLQGDSLTICQSGVDRPPSFVGRGGDSLTVLRRR